MITKPLAFSGGGFRVLGIFHIGENGRLQETLPIKKDPK
jgi:hypothetical protein